MNNLPKIEGDGNGGARQDERHDQSRAGLAHPAAAAPPHRVEPLSPEEQRALRTLQRRARLAREQATTAREYQRYLERKEKAREMTQRDIERANVKARRDPHQVRDYLDALRVLRQAANGAVDPEMFSLEARRFVARWHGEIRELLDKADGLLGGGA